MRNRTYKPRSKHPKITLNTFCPTGKGGGVDPTCGTGGGTSYTPKKVRTKIGGVDVTLEIQPDGAGKVVDGPKDYIGKVFRKKSTDSPKPSPQITKPDEGKKPNEPKKETTKVEQSKSKSLSTVDDATKHFKETYKLNLKKGDTLSEEDFLKQSNIVNDELTRLSSLKLVAKTVKERPGRGYEIELGTDFSKESTSLKGTESWIGSFKPNVGMRMAGNLETTPEGKPQFGTHMVSGDSLAGNFRHELAHEMFQHGLSTSKQREWYTVAAPFEGTNTVSRYGGSHPSELFSEAFAAYTNPYYERGSLPAKLEKWMDKNVRGDIPTATENQEYINNSSNISIKYPRTIQSVHHKIAVSNLFESIKNLALTFPSDRPPLLVAPRKKKEQSTESKFASTQVNLTGEAYNRLLTLAYGIPDSELAEDGRETQPHITVKYGLHTSDANEVQEVIRKFGTIRGTLTRINAFRSKDTGNPYDVLFVDVDSPGLHHLNKRITSSLPNTTTYPVYKPHATIAYLKPGLADKYITSTQPLNIPFETEVIEFSDKQRTQTTVTLNLSSDPLHDFSEWVLTGNVFCPTGEGGGVDPTCGKGESKGYGSHVEIGPDTGKPVEDTGHRFNRSGLKAAGDVFWSRERDYAEAFGEEVGGSGKIESGRVKLSNPLHVLAKTNQFSDPSFENPIIARAKTEGHDGVIFDDRVNGDRFYVVFGGKITTNTPPTQKALATIVYDLIDDITKAQATAIARAVMQGYNNDKSINQIAKEIERRLDMEPARALVIAQTEYVRVQAADALTEAERQGNKKVKFQASATACEECLKKNGKLYKIKDAQNVIPVHPSCNCVWADPVTNNVFCPTGVGGGINPTCSPNSSSSPLDNIKGMPKAAYQRVKEVTGRLRKKLVDRYGVKTATAIIVAAQGTSWASAAAAPFAGVPGAWVPSAITALPFIGLAELHHQITKPKKLVTNEDYITDNDRDLSDEEIQNAAQELIAELNRELGGITFDEVENVFCPTGKGGGRDPTCSPGGRAGSRTSVRTQSRLNKLKDVIDARNKQREANRGTGSRRVPKRVTRPVESVGGDTKRPINATGDRTGVDRSEPTSPNPTRIASNAERVNAKIDRLSGFFRGKGQHEVAGWLDQLKSHVNQVGVPAALEQLGGTGKKRKEKVQYEGGWDKDAFEHDDPGRHLAAFAESYLNRHGITMTHQMDTVRTDRGLVSSLTPSQGGTIKDHPAKSDFLPKDPKLFTDKLAESKALPGLEKSEDINKLIGKPVTHLTKEVHEQLDKEYGKDKWIVKAYGDDAAAGYGIFFPQRSRQIAEDARNTIWASGSELGKYGFKHHRNEAGDIIGIKHDNGDVYEFGTSKYEKTIQGDARHWADRAAQAAPNERAAALPGGGKEFMAQPAFEVVGISEADRARGVTIKQGEEGRVHVVTRNGKVEVVPHATWLKGENLPVVFETADTRAMAKAAQEAISKFPESERNGQIYAPDLVKTADGYRMVEANPANHTGSSGYLGNNPMIIDSYVSHMTGKEPTHVRFIRSLLSERNRDSQTENVFCPTGEGGGVDPTCSHGRGAMDTSHYEKMELPDLFKIRDKLETDIKQETAAINPQNPHADLRSSVAYSNRKTFTIEHIKVELVIAKKTDDKVAQKFHQKRLKTATKI